MEEKLAHFFHLGVAIQGHTSPEVLQSGGAALTRPWPSFRGGLGEDAMLSSFCMRSLADPEGKAAGARGVRRRPSPPHCRALHAAPYASLAPWHLPPWATLLRRGRHRPAG
ncbi:hypothetical protein E2C01_074750 [Portunus trituberculatus]|uniref:Uncharacterized protein n=1 Tax=Portunus trituberculatus TaxID=210409 RepID=A0A5B7I6G3_PORTR|nr:hypothetical protein [Portunus trituberculatus]